VGNMGDYQALVIVQAAGFTEGEVILYERLNMVPMLLEEYRMSRVVSIVHVDKCWKCANNMIQRFLWKFCHTL